MNRSPSQPLARGGVERGPRPVKWYRRISVKLAFGLGLAMFSIQFLAYALIVETARANLDQTLERLDVARAAASAPYADYLSGNLDINPNGEWVPAPDAADVIEGFLGVGESWVWVSPDERVLAVGEDLRPYAPVGSDWPLCDSSEYCGVTLADGDIKAGSTWTRLGIEGRHIGTFVLVFFDDPKLVAEVGQWQLNVDLLSRLVASAAVATLTSLLLVSLVTRRLSRLAADASTPLDEKLENVDLPGPFLVSGDDEISRLATALNTMRGRIEQLVESLADRDRQRREWIAQVSHDLRTPLTALTACLDRALDRSRDGQAPPDVAALTEALSVVRQDGQRLHTLVDDLFELARLDAKEDLILEPVPPGELVRQTVRGLRPMAQAQGIDLTAVVAPALPTVRADGRRLMRALENMLRNAVQFARTRVEIRVRCDAQHLRFEVHDDGPGLPEKNGVVLLGHGEGQPRRPDSTGLGLLVTRRVATAHGGTLEGANAPSGGAIVWIEIPIIPAH